MTPPKIWPLGSSTITSTTSRGFDAGTIPTNDATYFVPRVAAVGVRLLRRTRLAGDAVARDGGHRPGAALLHDVRQHRP